LTPKKQLIIIGVGKASCVELQKRTNENKSTKENNLKYEQVLLLFENYLKIFLGRIN
jgi:hypothetical protein